MSSADRDLPREAINATAACWHQSRDMVGCAYEVAGQYHRDPGALDVFARRLLSVFGRRGAAVRAERRRT